jgi:hypothetical protein
MEGKGDVMATKETDGFVWVGDEGHAVQGGGRIGWRVLDVGEIVEGGEGSGVLQGL